MSDDYTPTTEDIRAMITGFVGITRDLVGQGPTKEEAGGGFDRWLAAHRDSVLEEAAQVAVNRVGSSVHPDVLAFDIRALKGATS